MTDVAHGDMLPSSKVEDHGVTQPGAFGVLLRQHRATAGLTQEELAERAQVSARVVSDLERGVTLAPQRHTVQQLADALHLSKEDEAALRKSARRRPSPIEAASSPLVAHDRAPGIRTFLIADIRGYTRFTQEHGDEAAARFTRKFAFITGQIVEVYGGRIVETRGDEAVAVFESGRRALAAAVDLQHLFARETQANPALPFPVGIGMDAGEAVPVEGGYRGSALNLAARLCSVAGPGEILASEGLIHLAGRVEGLAYVDRGTVQAKGYVGPVRAILVLPQGEEPVTPDDPATPAVQRSLPIGGFLGALPAGPLAARQKEVDRILASVDAVAHGHGQLVFLAGEAGVGKTRLAQEVTLAAHDRGFLVAGGRCYEPQQTMPYYPFLDALSTVYTASPSGIRNAASYRWPYLGHLLPDQVGPPAVGPPAAASSAGHDEQQRLFRAVTDFIIAVAETRPLALFLDDLHWADGATLDLLQHLVRHTRAHPVLVVGTYRDVDVGRRHPLEHALRDLHREQLSEQLSIQRLDVQGTAAFIAATFGEEVISQEFAELVYRHTEGNPFFAQEVLRAFVERGDLYRDAGHWQRREIEDLSVPESIRAVIGERVSRLSDGAQGVLHEASVLGQEFLFDHLQAMSGRTEEEIESALEEAVSARLIREGKADTYSFDHVLIQHTLYAGISTRHRRRLHLAAAEALEASVEARRPSPRFGGPVELARHFLEGGEPERAVAYIVMAGDRADAIFAHAEAERHYRTALDLACEHEMRPREVEALEKLGGTMRWLSRHGDALEMLDRAAGMYRAIGDPEGEGRVEALIGMTHFSSGTSREGTTRFEPLLPALEGRVSPTVLCALYEAQSQLFFGTNEYRQHLESAERWVDAARETGDVAILARAHGRQGTALSLLGRMEEGIRALEEALILAEKTNDVYAQMFALNDLAASHMWTGALNRALVLQRRAVDAAERLGYEAEVAFHLCGLSEVLLILGEWKQARFYIDRARAMIGPLVSWFSTYPALNFGQLCLLEGDEEEAKRHLEMGLDTAQRNQDILGIREGQYFLSQLDLRRGRFASALARLEPLLDRPGLQEATVLYLMPVMAEAQLEMGRVADAEQTVDAAIERSNAQGYRLELPDALRVRGILLERQGRFSDACRTLEESASLAAGMPYPHDEARALLTLGRIHMHQGERAQARARLHEALAIFRRLGARLDAERSEQALAELDRG